MVLESKFGFQNPMPIPIPDMQCTTFLFIFNVVIVFYYVINMFVHEDNKCIIIMILALSTWEARTVGWWEKEKVSTPGQNDICGRIIANLLGKVKPRRSYEETRLGLMLQEQKDVGSSPAIDPPARPSSLYCNFNVLYALENVKKNLFKKIFKFFFFSTSGIFQCFQLQHPRPTLEWSGHPSKS